MRKKSASVRIHVFRTKPLEMEPTVGRALCHADVIPAPLFFSMSQNKCILHLAATSLNWQTDYLFICWFICLLAFSTFVYTVT